MSGFEKIFSSDGFMPHGLCLAWQPEVFWLMAISDTLIALAYYSIPLALTVFSLRRRDLRYRWLLHLFSLFIVACGTTHILAVWTLWDPVYGIEAMTKAITAVASILTAVMLWPLIPKLLALPSPTALAVCNGALRMEIAERTRAEAETRRLAEELEARVAVRTAEYESMNRQLRAEIDQRTRLAHELDIARHEAESANRTKSEFLARMSHELRTPLNAIIGFSELMAGGVMGRLMPERYQDYMEDILRSGRHLLSVVNDLLDLARIESGTLRLNEEPVPLDEAFGEMLRMFHPQADAAGVTLTTDVPPSLPDLQVDQRSLRQMLINLIANALRFTDPPGRIEMSAHLEPDGGIAIVVADTGVGMDPQAVPEAFTAYGRASRNSDREGTGLGLPIVKGLMERHGGTLRITSRPGEGTTVTLRFPADRTMPR